MTWNYRIIKYTDSEGTSHFGIHEVYYDATGRPETYTESACSPYGESFDEFESDLNHMAEALRLPVLTDEDFTKEKTQ